MLWQDDPVLVTPERPSQKPYVAIIKVTMLRTNNFCCRSSLGCNISEHDQHKRPVAQG